MRITPALLAHAVQALQALLQFTSPADQALSRYFRAHRELGQRDRAFIAETAFAVLRRKRSLEGAAGSGAPQDLVLAALVRLQGLSLRALSDAVGEEGAILVERLRASKPQSVPLEVQADLPDWLWHRSVTQYGLEPALALAQGMHNSAPLDLRVNVARTGRDEVLAQLKSAGVEGEATRYAPTGIRLRGKPAINRDPLFLEGLVEVQDEGSQILACLLAPRRGEMVADYCAGAGGKTLALGALMRNTGRVYAMDISVPRLAELNPRLARSGLSNIHPVAIAGEKDPRARRLAGKLDRVLVDAPCSGFGTLRRNPDLKWRHAERAIGELADKQGGILAAASRLVKPGGRLIYATCSILRDENEAIAEAFLAVQPNFRKLSCAQILAGQRIALDTGEYLRLLPHLHQTDGFFAAAFERIEGE